MYDNILNNMEFINAIPSINIMATLGRLMPGCLLSMYTT